MTLKTNKKMLTREAADEYIKKAKLCPEFGHDIGAIRKLKMQMCKEYDVTELEAINILSGHHVNDYILKYELRKNGFEIKKSKIAESEKEEVNITDDWLYQRILELEEQIKD